MSLVCLLLNDKEIHWKFKWVLKKFKNLWFLEIFSFFVEWVNIAELEGTTADSIYWISLDSKTKFNDLGQRYDQN